MKRSLKKGTNKKIRNATKIESNDIKFRSKLEEYTNRKLIEAGITNFEYEKHKFTLVEPFEYPFGSYNKEGNLESTSVRAMTYTPDFVYLNDVAKGWIIEVKGFSNDAFPLKWKLFKKHLDKNGFDVALFKPNNQKNVMKCIEIIKEKYYV